MKQILRWLVLGGTLFFLAKALKDHWLEVTALRIDAVGWSILAIATGVTLLAHTWAGLVWTWILQELNQPIHPPQFIQAYLKTNIVKYVPGNVWHYYGRIMAAKNANVTPGIATLSVLLEPLLMAAAALIIVLLNSLIATENTNSILFGIQTVGLIAVLLAIHPQILNHIIGLFRRLKGKMFTKASLKVEIPPLGPKRYPLKPLLGELCFVVMRGTGFILTVLALTPVNLSQIPFLLGAFSCAWLLGLVVPGAPGGLGVFEATAIALLEYRFPVAVVIGAVGLYRLASILAETIGAASAWLDERLFQS